MATRYYTADSAGIPWAVFRTPDGGVIEVFDTATGTWVAEGWPIKYLAGGDNNYSDLAPRDVDAAIAAVTPRDVSLPADLAGERDDPD